MKIIYIITIFVFSTFICSSKGQQMEKKNQSIRFKRLFPSISRACMRDNHVTPERVMGVYTLSTNDRDAKCYVSCMLLRFNVTDTTGNYNHQVLEKLLIRPNINEAVIKTVLEKCEREDDKDGCEKAIKFTKCIYSHKNEFGVKENESASTNRRWPMIPFGKHP